MTERWTVTFRIRRSKQGQSPRYDSFPLEVRPDEYVLDGIERIWANQDRSLTFAHACHHSVCGACGMVVNGVEKLTCITPISAVTRDGGTVQVDPLRHFPVVSDLVVDMGEFYGRMHAVGFPQVVPVTEAPTGEGIKPAENGRDPEMMRLVDCIECGMCISACPIVGTSPAYLGPAVLAAVQHRGLDEAPHLIDLVDNQDGAWRCHGIHACTEVCPSNVEPAWRIMDLRKQILRHRVAALFRRSPEVDQ